MNPKREYNKRDDEVARRPRHCRSSADVYNDGSALGRSAGEISNALQCGGYSEPLGDKGRHLASASHCDRHVSIANVRNAQCEAVQRPVSGKSAGSGSASGNAPIPYCDKNRCHDHARLHSRAQHGCRDGSRRRIGPFVFAFVSIGNFWRRSNLYAAAPPLSLRSLNTQFFDSRSM